MNNQNQQTDLFNQSKGEELRDKGIQQSVDHADAVDPNWSDKAYYFLVRYMENNKEFMVEEVRAASRFAVPVPPSARAWGSTILRAKKDGLVEHAGFRQVSNEKAHCTPASVWRVK